MTRSRCAALALLVVLLSAGTARAQETTLQNDSLDMPDSGTPCKCFLSNDEVTAWLTSTCPGSIVALQVGFSSNASGSDPSELALRVKAPGVFPAAGATRINGGGGPAEIPNPTLQDGVLTEFRFLDAGMTVPLDVPVTQGETFVVALEYLNQTSGGGPFTSDIVWDNDGCQASRNSVFTANQWFDACTQGVTGDWMLRAVVDCDPPVDALPPGAVWGLAALLLLALLAPALQRLR